ncbi:MAG: CvpA family protein [Phycisphaerales bacterium]
MTIILNLILVGIAGLIAYWWANQGFFSALLHFICVVVAGAIALSVWEFVTVSFLLTGGWFDEYAWGVSLLGTFAVSLFVLRLIFDKTVPDNVNVPTWVNYTFGSVFGAGAAILTVGICMIGAGFMQSSVDLVGFRGMARDSATQGQPGSTGQLYPPMHAWTSAFYTALSDGALTPTFTNASLKRSYPALADEALSLHRDSAWDGEGKTSLSPGAATVDEAFFARNAGIGKGGRGAFGVKVTFDRAAFDRGEMLVVSASQVRLIALKNGEAIAIHPVRWVQITGGSPVEHSFDDVTHYATSVPGQQQSSILFLFPASELAGATPQFIQIKGLRFRLPATLPDLDEMAFLAKKQSLGGTAIKVAYDPNAPVAQDGEINVDNGIQPLNISKNQVTSMQVVEDMLASGREEFLRDSPFNPGRQLRVKGLLQAEGTKVVKVDVSRGVSSLDIWDDKYDFRKRAGSNAAPMLVDSDGRTYTAEGYFWIKPDKIEVKLDPVKGLKTVSDVPNLPSAGTHKLFLLFQVSEGVKLVGFRLGDVTVANCDVNVGNVSGKKGGFGSLAAP